MILIPYVNLIYHNKYRKYVEIMKIKSNTEGKKSSIWNKMRLRGRLLTIMLTVSVTSVLICVISFVVTNNRMLNQSREDTNVLSDNVHFMVEMAFYQQETHIRRVYAFAQADFINRKLSEIKDKNETPDWNGLVKDVYNMVNNWDVSLDLGEENTLQFIIADGIIYVYGSDKEIFIDMAENFFKQLNDSGIYKNTGFMNDLQERPDIVVYSKGEGGMICVWVPFDGGAGRVGLMVPNVNALRMSEGLRFLMDNETGAAMENMTNTAWQSIIGFVLVIAVLLIVLPLVSGRLAVFILNPVEQEQERQRNLLNASEEEKERLEEMDKLKTEFYQDMHHEMKTPLHVINTDIQNADDMLDFDIDKSVVQKRLESAQQEIVRLARMVENSLDLAAAYVNQKHMEQINFASLLRSKAGVFASLLEKNGNRLSLKIPDGLPQITGNADMLSQVIFNLMYNAHRHTQNGEITVSLSFEKPEQSGGMLNAVIRDTGEGIAADILPSVFERGVSSNGTGYGLSICKTIIEMHGGSIDIDSVFGTGTVVTFTLPVQNKDTDGKGE